MPGRDSEDEIWSRFVFELVKWTQSSGPLCLWQCLNDRSNNFRSSCSPQLWRKPAAPRTSWDGLSGSMTRMDLVWKTNIITFSFIRYTKSNIQKLCIIFRNYWFRGDDRNHHKSLLTWRTDTGGQCQQFWFIWKVWSTSCLLSACLLMYIDICWPKDSDTPSRRQFCLSRVKI